MKLYKVHITNNTSCNICYVLAKKWDDVVGKIDMHDSLCTGVVTQIELIASDLSIPSIPDLIL